MKAYTRYFFIAITFLMLNFVFVTATYADSPPPPPAHGQTGNQVPGGGAAIGGGALILALLGAGYGAKKWYDNHKKPLAE
jgi:hypothetical protein